MFALHIIVKNNFRTNHLFRQDKKSPQQDNVAGLFMNQYNEAIGILSPALSVSSSEVYSQLPYNMVEHPPPVASKSITVQGD